MAPHTFFAAIALATAASLPASLLPAGSALAGQAETSQSTRPFLEKAIGSLQSGSPDMSLFTPELGAEIEKQGDALGTFLNGLGAMQSISYTGSEQGADVYGVQFENGRTAWAIAVNEEEKISFLLVQPADPQTGQ